MREPGPVPQDRFFSVWKAFPGNPAGGNIHILSNKINAYQWNKESYNRDYRRGSL
jgi:hypothetical protein